MIRGRGGGKYYNKVFFEKEREKKRERKRKREREIIFLFVFTYILRGSGK